MKPEEIKEFKITVEFSNSLAGYLSTKPYKESAPYIEELKRAFGKEQQSQVTKEPDKK